MIHEKNHLIKRCHAHAFGPNGIECECCCPQGKARTWMYRKMKRTLRKSLKAELRKEVLQ